MPTFLLSLFFVLFSQTLVSGDSLYYTCDDHGNHGSYDYQTYVGMIYGTISTQAATFGYGFRRVKEVHGSLLCRGDVHPDECKSCYQQAYQILRGACPTMLQAYGYSDYCSLQHTYKIEDWDANIYYCSAGNVVPADQAWFSGVLSELFHQVAHNAPLNAKYMYAMFVDLGDSYTLYGYGQCNNEIPAGYCQACLGYLKAMLVASGVCTNGFIGGRLATGSCIVRYELYPFLNFN